MTADCLVWLKLYFCLLLFGQNLPCDDVLCASSRSLSHGQCFVKSLQQALSICSSTRNMRLLLLTPPKQSCCDLVAIVTTACCLPSSGVACDIVRDLPWNLPCYLLDENAECKADALSAMAHRRQAARSMTDPGYAFQQGVTCATVDDCVCMLLLLCSGNQSVQGTAYVMIVLLIQTASCTPTATAGVAPDPNFEPLLSLHYRGVMSCCMSTHCAFSSLCKWDMQAVHDA